MGNDDETQFVTFYYNSKAETINESDIDDIFESLCKVLVGLLTQL